MAELGCKADSSARYLGIQLGVVSPEESFAPALGKALARARSVAHLGLDLLERAELLPTWIVPIFAFPAKAYFPTPSVCSSLRSVYFLGVTSCPPSRTPYTHDVRIFYISSLSMLFDICEQCWYQRCVTSIEIGGDVLALGIRFI